MQQNSQQANEILKSNHNDTEDASASQDTAPLDNTPLNCGMPEQDSESSHETQQGPQLLL